ncbi:putative Acyltransferase, group 3; O-antigen acetylase [Bradyrhizobium sp. ORS 375]|uniref:acyltransferase family protein n=1 Tax=Bradyrhizobium sp. (strain ORS 375) TaxID=566679 RepID=UPI0002408AA7|nr:acyltransferase family protein [Bradyrhizobium sp. ORS 375]CCD90369.1 putative Acyltransferase, group 3; O-antigen acetylase [Bradyrhizobium sp. ORS 375]
MKTQTYRPDIDGLRAIAVVSVVLFHAIPRKPLGGFVGVDIFFVISGFLITGIISADLAAGAFSISGFYERRVRRIFPALAVVLLFCLAAGWFVLFPSEYALLGKHVVAGGAFAANLINWSEAGYFDVAAETKPLLHLWSLGIEEQYYLAWPAILWGIWRLRLSAITITAICIVASFVYCVQLTAADPTAAFYNPASRAWELLLGSLLALGAQRGRELGPTMARVVSVVGLLLLVYSLIDTRPADGFPGWHPALPTVGTALLIAGGPHTWINRNVLGNSAARWIGSISYPLYLWHWPLLSLYRTWTFQHPPLSMALLIIGLSVVLAWITTRLVEAPIRFSTRRFRAATACMLLLVAVAGGTIVASASGFSARFDSQFAGYFTSLVLEAGTHPEERAAIDQNQCNFYDFEAANKGFPTLVPRQGIAPSCYMAPPGRRSVMLWGDSHAAAYLHGLQNEVPRDVAPLLVFGSGCSVYVPDPLHPRRPYCDRTNDFVLQVINQHAPDILLIAPSTPVPLDVARQLATMARQAGVKHVVVVGPLPRFVADLYKIVLRRYWPEVPRRIRGFTTESFALTDRTFRASLGAAEPFEYLSMMDHFCNDDGCLVFVGDDPKAGLVVLDKEHLRPMASRFAAKTALVPVITRLLTADEAGSGGAPNQERANRPSP